MKINPINAIADSVSGVLGSLDGLITSKEERMEKDNELAEIRNHLAEIQRDIYSKAADVEISLTKAQSTVLSNETSGNRLQRSWRPILMLCFGGIIIYQYFLVHLINVILAMADVTTTGELLQIPEFNLPDRFWMLLEIGIGGYIAGRSLEKIVPNVSEKIVAAKESRRMTEELQARQSERSERRERRASKQEERIERREERREQRIARKEERRHEKNKISDSIKILSLIHI